MAELTINQHMLTSKACVSALNDFVTPELSTTMLKAATPAVLQHQAQEVLLWESAAGTSKHNTARLYPRDLHHLLQLVALPNNSQAEQLLQKSEAQPSS